MEEWKRANPLREELVAKRLKNADEAAIWIAKVKKRSGHCGQAG
ncbi:hypothetical protein [Sedimentisphaera cyanobacteriorum]|nr:hypothetical protein [Sedimentisphaera cyanobacteriorum]